MSRLHSTLKMLITASPMLRENGAALVMTPSMRDSRKPSMGLKVSFCTPSSGWLDMLSVRSRSPSTCFITSGACSRRAASRIICPGRIWATRPAWPSSSGISSKPKDPAPRSSTVKRRSRTCRAMASSRPGLSRMPSSCMTWPSRLRSRSTAGVARSRSSWLMSP